MEFSNLKEEKRKIVSQGVNKAPFVSCLMRTTEVWLSHRNPTSTRHLKCFCNILCISFDLNAEVCFQHIWSTLYDYPNVFLKQKYKNSVNCFNYIYLKTAKSMNIDPIYLSFKTTHDVEFIWNSRIWTPPVGQAP